MIHTFKEAHTRWLSNMVPVEINFKGKTFPSVEHAYMSAKIDDEEWRVFCTSPERTSGQIKRITNDALLVSSLVSNWDEIKLEVMETCLREKFNQEPFKTKLIETGNENIQEGNWWNDKFFGVDLKETPNIGENHLGRLIMKIRSELQEERFSFRIDSKTKSSFKIKCELNNMTLISRLEYLIKMDVDGKLEVKD